VIDRVITTHCTWAAKSAVFTSGCWRPQRHIRQTGLTRHPADCLGQAHGPGGRGVSTRLEHG